MHAYRFQANTWQTMNHANPTADIVQEPASFFRRLLGRSFPRIIVVVGVLLHLFGFFAFSLVSDTHYTQELPTPAISLSSTYSLGIDLEEQAALLDSEPLFLPTRWNEPLQAKHSATALNPDLAPDMLEAQVAMSATQVTEHSLASDTLEQPYGNRPLLITEGFASTPLKVNPLPSRAAYLIIRDSHQGQIIYEGILPLENSDQNISGELWLPLRATMHYNASGLLGEPLLLESSGAVERDELLLTSFKQRIATMSFAPGYYFIQIGL